MPYEGWADYHSHGYGGDKAEFTEERADLQHTLHTLHTYITNIFSNSFLGSWQGPKGKLAGT